MANYARLFRLPSKLTDLDTGLTGALLDAWYALRATPWLTSLKDSNGVTILALSAGATPVNNWLINNSPTDPVLTVQGTGTNINPTYRAKGTGKHKFQDGADTTKAITLDIATNVPTGTTRNIIIPNGDILLAGSGSFAQTFSGSRINPRLVTTVTTSPLAPSIATADLYTVTGLANAMTISSPAGTPVDGNRIRFRFKDNGTSQTLTWNAIFRAMGVTIPTATVISKTLYVTTEYNAVDTKWDVVSVNQEA